LAGRGRAYPIDTPDELIQLWLRIHLYDVPDFP